ncbi:hypothetical protein AC578_5990 [Pseudocercospora eumusae]|uniref:Rxt3-domain-containing protein n=1 Tax=Pseudocercospora eumusae TaxID=321146 RepID=A0A139HVG8_9PEZI|nr:hypothetical protein AC578_5990 [Pseudocercospora eumusae]
MDRNPFSRPQERHVAQNQTAPPPSSHSSPFPPPTAQPPVQIPFSDPFSTHRDPFLPGGGGSAGPPSRGWPPAQGNVNSSSQAQPHHHHLAQPSHTPNPGHSLPPPPPANGMSSMPPPYDSLRRRSLGNAGSPPQQVGAPPLEPPPPPPPFSARNMPPPSSPQNAPSSSLHPGAGAPRGPPTTSPFAGVRDLAGSHHRPGMSISAILGGGGEERRPHESPHSSHAGPAHTPKPMHPPSPGRARSYSNREGGERGYNKSSPPRPGVFGEPARIGSEPRREGIFGSPQFRREPQHGFRAFQTPMQEHAHHLNGHGAPARPTSQPAEVEHPRGMQEQREPVFDHRTGGFRSAAEHLPSRSAEPPRADLRRHERPHFPHNGITSHPQERPPFSSPQMERERSNQGPMRFPSGPGYGVHAREEQTALFRPAYPPTSHPAPEPARESIEGRAAEMRRQISRHSPPVGELGAYDRGRNGFHERPVTLEEHQRMEAIQREQQRKESEGSMHKAILNISPELNRRGRNSPLPQAVQGAQPRHIGPGGDNPGIKMEFGRMFSGLGSGVGTTPAPSHPINGTTTPSRMSPAARHVESGDLVRSAAVETTEQRVAKSGTRLGRKSGRRSRDESDGVEGRNTPDPQRGMSKRTKTTHTNHHHHHVHPHHHHHHHHHHDGSEAPGASNMLRHPSNPLSHANLMANQAHHHHHHAHPVGHHHHHAPKSAPTTRKPATIVQNKRVLDELAGKPRKHLGSQLYTTELSPAPAAETTADSKIKFSSKMKPIPVFAEKENCTYTVRVPRYYLSSSLARAEESYSFEEICKRRQIWGTDIYTDDSDVIAAAVHSGWIKGDFGEYNEDLNEVFGNDSDNEGPGESPLSLDAKPRRPVKVPEGFDAHITVLILPPLEFYGATNRHHLWSREWKKHDGMSYMIHSIEFVNEGEMSRYAERNGAARKQRIAVEEAARREAAAGLLMFANAATSRVQVEA